MASLPVCAHAVAAISITPSFRIISPILAKPRNLLHDGVLHTRIRKLRAISGALSRRGQQARGQRLLPLEREARDVAEDARDLLLCNVAGQRDSVEPAGADGRISQQ